MAQIAKVLALTGNAYVVGTDGLLRPLKVGDQIEKGEIVRTAEGARVELMMADGQTVAVAPDVNVRVDESMVQADNRPTTPESAVQAATVDAVIQALDRGDDLNQTLEAAAAGLGSGAESGGDATFVRLLRIVEPVDPLAYNYALSPLPTVQTANSAVLPETIEQPVITVSVTDEPLPQDTDGPVSVSPEVIALSASGMQVIEGTDAGTKVVNFLFTLDKVAPADITITFVVRPGSATAEVDFADGAIGTPVTMIIPAGVNGFVVPVNIVTDAGVEGNETFNIQLLSANGATLGNTTAEVTIIDDDIALTSAVSEVDETDGLDQVSGNLTVNYSGSGSTPVISLKADDATWDPDTRTLTDDNGAWQIVMANNGAYTFTQLKAMNHPLIANSDDAVEVKISATVVTSLEVNGQITTSIATGEIVVTVRDDGPTVTLQTDPVTVSAMLDETGGLGTVTTSASAISGMFASSVFGQDGEGTASYQLNANNGVATGLYLTSDPEHAHEIKLVKISDIQYEGWSDGNTSTGVKAFTIGINGLTGAVTVTQNAALDHPLGGGEHDDSVVLEGNATVWVSLVVSDADGDTAQAGSPSASALSIIFKDDGPSLTVTSDSSAAASLALNLDETAGSTDRYATGETTDTAINDDASSTIARQITTLSGGLSSLFSISASTGADGGTVASSGTLSLQLLGATAGKVATTLSTVDGGMVSLEMSGSDVLGKDSLGHTVLSISIVSNQLQVTLLEPLNHATDGSTAYDEVLSLWTVGTGTALQLQYSVTQTDADGDSITRSDSVNIASTNAGALSFDDDGPTLTVTNPYEMAFNFVSPAASSPVSGTYTFSSGADTATFGTSFGASTALAWNNKPTGYTFVQTDSTWDGTTDHSLTWTAKNQSGVSQFQVTVDDSGHYQFQLLAPIGPSISSTGNLMAGISGGSGLDFYDFAASNFGGAFILRVDGLKKDGSSYVDSTVTISATELGVAGNTLQPGTDKLVLSVLPQTGFEDASIAKIYMSMADTGGLKAGDSFTYEVLYADGSSQTYTESVPDDLVNTGNPGVVVFDNFDPSRVVSSIQLWTTGGGNTWKVDGFSVDYYKNISANDANYSFTLTGQDGDGDTTSASFGVAVGVGTAGNDQLIGGSGVDHMSAGAGDDNIFGGKGDDVIDGGSGNDTIQGGIGNDTMTGGLGADVFKWTLGDVGTLVSPALDTVDFNAAQGDSLDLRDLLSNEHSGVLAFNLTDYIAFGQDANGKLLLSIDPDGTGAGGVTQKIVLDNYGGTGVSLDAAKQALWADIGGTGTLATHSDPNADLIKQLVAHGNVNTSI